MTNLWLWKGACSRVSSGCISFAPFLSSMRRRRLEWCNCTLLVWLKGRSMLPGDRNETGSHAGHLYMYINISSLYLTKNSNSVGLRIKMVVTSSEKPRSGLKWPFTIVPKIRSMASSLGIVTFKMKKCLRKRSSYYYLQKQVPSSASLGCRSFHHQDGSWLQGTSCPVKKNIKLFQGSHIRNKALASVVLSQQNSTDLLY